MAKTLTNTAMKNMKKPAEGKLFCRKYDGDGLFIYAYHDDLELAFSELPKFNKSNHKAH